MTERPALAVEGNRIPSTRALMEPSNWVSSNISISDALSGTNVPFDKLNCPLAFVPATTVVSNVNYNLSKFVSKQ